MAAVSVRDRHNLIYRPILRDKKSALRQVEYQYRAFHGLAYRYRGSLELQTHVLAPAKFEQCGKDICHALYRKALTKFWYKPSVLLRLPYRYLMQIQERYGLVFLQLQD